MRTGYVLSEIQQENGSDYGAKLSLSGVLDASIICDPFTFRGVVAFIHFGIVFMVLTAKKNMASRLTQTSLQSF
jgi:hypothetical protein